MSIQYAVFACVVAFLQPNVPVGMAPPIIITQPQAFYDNCATSEYVRNGYHAVACQRFNKASQQSRIFFPPNTNFTSEEARQKLAHEDTHAIQAARGEFPDTDDDRKRLEAEAERVEKNSGCERLEQ